jgi:hypothetical protein
LFSFCLKGPSPMKTKNGLVSSRIRDRDCHSWYSKVVREAMRGRGTGGQLNIQ